MEEIDRRKYLGGSEIACLFGLNQYKSLYELWQEKTAETVVEEPIESRRERILRRGKKLEPWIIELLEEERGIYVVLRNVRCFDQEFPWMTCQLDFQYMDDDFGLNNGEVKTVSPFAAFDWGEQDTDQIPLAYCLQALWGLGITKNQRTLFGALIGADDLRVHFVDRDEDLIQESRRRAYQFWTENVLKKIPPPPVTKLDFHKALYKKQGFVSAGSPEMWQAIKRIRGIKMALKALKEKQDEYELAIKSYLLAEAEAMGLKELKDSPPRFIINDISGKKMASLSLEDRKGYTVGPSQFLVLRT